LRVTNHRWVITIDGPAGAGKSTTAKLLASRLGYIYLDTGALYRAVAWQVQTTQTDYSHPTDMGVLLDSLQLHLSFRDGNTVVSVNSQDVTPHLRTPEISRLASTIAALPSVREWLLPFQQGFAESGGIVVEGRDMGTRVFPLAEKKFFLEADVHTRATRRHKDVIQAGHSIELQEVEKEVVNRDTQDRSRNISPLTPAPDAIIIDSSTMTIDQVVDTMMESLPAPL